MGSLSKVSDKKTPTKHLRQFAKEVITCAAASCSGYKAWRTLVHL